MLHGWISTLDGAARIASRRIGPGETVAVGRMAEVPVGVVDHGVSAIALTVTATSRGWRLDSRNRNGMDVQPWGWPRTRGRPRQAFDDALVAVRVHGAVASAEHWVLLEADPSGADEVDDLRPSGTTEAAALPNKLTAAELAAVEAVFGALLVWPPVALYPTPRGLTAAARLTGLSVSGLQDRLKAVRAKAVRLGFDGVGTLTEPGYVHVLAAWGYLSPPETRLGGNPAT